MTVLVYFSLLLAADPDERRDRNDGARNRRPVNGKMK